MSKNVQTVQAMYAAFGKGDVPTILSYIADDVDWEWGGSDHGVPWLKPGKGKAHAGKFFDELRKIEFLRFEPFAFLADGDLVAVPVHLEAKYTPTGKVIKDLQAHLWGFDKNGKVNRMRHWTDTVQHVKAFSGADI
ncbi:MAG: nuclear transport factor 2 family protein [Planctomycetes bacterium]|nr:nuclear transport factor 2 family protein [Planctomycetota bacterium]